MNNKTFIGLGATLLIVVIGFVVLNTNSTETTMEKAETTRTTETPQETQDSFDQMEEVAADTDESPDTATTDKYVTYSKKALADSAGKKQVLFFHAGWCPTCKTADRAFKENESRIPSDVVVLKTDYDKESELKKKYGIGYQHTFVQIDEQGNEVTAWNGGDVDTLLKNLQ